MKYLFHLSLLSFVTFNGLNAMALNEQVVKGVLKIVPTQCRFIGSEEVAYFKRAFGLEVDCTDLLVPICAGDENRMEDYFQDWNQRVHVVLARPFTNVLPLSLIKGKQEDDIIRLCFYGKAVELKCVSCVGDPRNPKLVAFEQALANLRKRTLTNLFGWL